MQIFYYLYRIQTNYYEYKYFFVKFYGYFLFLFAGTLLISKKVMKVMIAAPRNKTNVIFIK